MNEREAILAKLQAVADAYGELAAEIHRQRPWDVLNDWTFELEWYGPIGPREPERPALRLDYKGKPYDHAWVKDFPVL